MSNNFENTKQDWESHDEWRFADRDAERRYFFEAGQSVSAARIAELEESLLYVNLKPCPQCDMSEEEIKQQSARIAKLDRESEYQAQELNNRKTIIDKLQADCKAIANGNITQAKEVNVTILNMKMFIAELVKRNMEPTMLEAKAGPTKAWVKANGFDTFPGLHIEKTSSVRF